MSFSKKVKEELAGQIGTARHCRLAELAAIIDTCGRIWYRNETAYRIEILTENQAVARKCFTLLEKTFNINTGILARQGNLSKKYTSYEIRLEEPEQAALVCQAVKAVRAEPVCLPAAPGEAEAGEAPGSFTISSLVVQNTCCKRAFIRGVFLAAGSVSDPEKSYHFEIVFSEKGKAVQTRDIINSFSMDAKIVMRKKYYVVYVKEGSQIVDLLNIMGAHVSLMELENVRILKEMRNSINRQVNCEAANINKTVLAAAKQIDDIIYIRDTIGFDNLTEGLEEIATLRINYPDASLKELGEMLSVPLGKSGVNHRLKKLSGIAMGLRELKEE